MGFFASSGIVNRRGFLPPPMFIPTQIANLGLWLDANVGVNKDGSNLVSQWDDQSGNGRNVTYVLLDSRKPTYLANNINGLPAISFDGVNDFLTTPAFLWSAGASSVFTVLKGNPPATSDKYAIGERGYNGGANYNSIYAPVYSNVLAGSPRFSTRIIIDDVSVFSPPSFGSFDNQYKLFSVIDSGTVINGYVNGVPGGTQNYSRVQPILGPITHFSIGAAYAFNAATGLSSASGPFAGIFAEIIIYTRALNDTERVQVENYLRSKWRL